MKECCDKWLKTAEPQNAKRGRFWELQRCPQCKVSYRLVFESVDVLGHTEPIEYVLVAAEIIISR